MLAQEKSHGGGVPTCGNPRTTSSGAAYTTEMKGNKTECLLRKVTRVLGDSGVSEQEGLFIKSLRGL